MAQVPHALPSLPPQSTAQKFIAKAREAEATKAAAAASAPLQQLPNPVPQPSKPAATPQIEPVAAAPPAKELAREMAGAAAQKRNTAIGEKAASARQQTKEQHALIAAPQKLPAPEARLKGDPPLGSTYFFCNPINRDCRRVTATT